MARTHWDFLIHCLFWNQMWLRWIICLFKYFELGTNKSQIATLLSQPHFEGVVRSPLTLLKMGLGSPSGLPKTQSMIARVKTLRIETFFIPLQRTWSVDVQNGLAWAIWNLQHKLWLKEGTGVKLPIWLLTTKSRVQVECNTPLESS
jgi:hypothetical protein